MKKYKSIAFDLDDTLLDTTGLLVPMASQKACEAMLDAGLRCTMQDCLQMRQELAADLSHTEIFTQIVNRYGTNQKGKAIHDALEKFYNPTVPESLPLLPDALENLEKLVSEYKLFLVTMGSYESQVRKIKALKIEQYFSKIYVLNGFIGERKESAFLDILRNQKHLPHELLSFGNRLSSEIREGKKVGADTCYFAFGEHLGEKKIYPEDHPDFTVTKHSDFIPVCGL